jgi:hypothetical protein
MTRFDECGQIVDEPGYDEQEARAEVEKILSRIPVTDFEKEYGIRRPEIGQRVGEYVSKYFPTFTRAYLNLSSGLKKILESSETKR